uniref:Uncharacterized protein n=1 Tax=Anopheles arabiensis TaxID=7173 RepID=A0A453YKC2_ANOAR
MEDGTQGTSDRSESIAARTGWQPSSVPSNEQLVQGLMGTIIILSSTLYQAIEGEDGGPDRLLQSLVPVQERLEQVLHRIQAQEAQAHRSAAASYDRTARPRTSAAHLHTVCEPFAPPSSSTEQETGLHADVSSKGGQHLPGADPSFVVPAGWREITNLDRYLEETTGGTEESLEQTEGGNTAAYGVSKRTQTTIVDRGEKVPFDPKLGQSSPIVQGDGGPGSSSSKQTHGQTFTYHSAGPKRLLEGLMVRGSNNLLPQGTFAIRETSNYALPDGSFQRSTKTVAGPDVSVLAKCSQPMLPVDPLGSVSRFNIVPSAPPSEEPLDSRLGSSNDC